MKNNQNIKNNKCKNNLVDKNHKQLMLLFIIIKNKGFKGIWKKWIKFLK